MIFPWKGFRPRAARFSASLAVCLVFVACSPPEAGIQLGGSLSVLPIGAAFDDQSLPDDWITSGHIPDGHLAGNSKLGSATLSVTATSSPYIVARRVKANVLATPYLSWKWQLQKGNWKYHPISLVVGFRGGGETKPRTGLTDALFPSRSFPKFDRLLVMQWAPSALMRGSLKTSPMSSGEIRRSVYTVRGGPENAGRWWTETVDLSALYQKSWPSDQISASRIAFIGVASAQTTVPATAFISDLRLSR